MGGKPRKRGVALWAWRSRLNAVTAWKQNPLVARGAASFVCSFGVDDWPGPPIAPGECKRVHVTIEEDK